MTRTRSNKKVLKGTRKNRKGGMFGSRPIGNTGFSYSVRHGVRPTYIMKHREKLESSPWLWVAVIFFMILSHMAGPQMKISQAVDFAAKNGMDKVVNVVPNDYRSWSHRVLNHGKSEQVTYRINKSSVERAFDTYKNASPTEKTQIEDETKKLLQEHKIDKSPSRTSSRSRSRGSRSASKN
jgi:hypothetical protein